MSTPIIPPSGFYVKDISSPIISRPNIVNENPPILILGKDPLDKIWEEYRQNGLSNLEFRLQTGGSVGMHIYKISLQGYDQRFINEFRHISDGMRLTIMQLWFELAAAGWKMEVIPKFEDLVGIREFTIYREYKGILFWYRTINFKRLYDFVGTTGNISVDQFLAAAAEYIEASQRRTLGDRMTEFFEWYYQSLIDRYAGKI